MYIHIQLQSFFIAQFFEVYIVVQYFHVSFKQNPLPGTFVQHITKYIGKSEHHFGVCGALSNESAYRLFSELKRK